MRKRYVIDGYNLIHRIRSFSTDTAEDLHKQRENLIHKLVVFSALRKIEFQVVFDSTAGRRERESYPGVKVDYASPNADTFIRRIITRNTDNPDLVIVSSDRKDIGNFAEISGLSWMTSEQFWSLMNASRVNSTDHQREDGEEPPAGWNDQDDEWLRNAFGD